MMLSRVLTISVVIYGQDNWGIDGSGDDPRRLKTALEESVHEEERERGDCDRRRRR